METRLKFLFIAEAIVVVGTVIKVLIRRTLLGWVPALVDSLIFPFGIGTGIVFIIYFIWNLIGKFIDMLKKLLNPAGAVEDAAKGIAGGASSAVGKIGGLF